MVCINGTEISDKLTIIKAENAQCEDAFDLFNIPNSLNTNHERIPSPSRYQNGSCKGLAENPILYFVNQSLITINAFVMYYNSTRQDKEANPRD